MSEPTRALPNSQLSYEPGKHSFWLSENLFANDLQRLAQICDQSWDQALKKFYPQDVDREIDISWGLISRITTKPTESSPILQWLKKQGIRGAASKVEEIIDKYKSKDRRQKSVGLNQFLQWSGYIDPPILAVSELKVDFGSFPKGFGHHPTTTLTITNQGRGCLIGELIVKVNWITCKSDRSFVLPPGESYEVFFETNVDSLQGGQIDTQKAIEIHSEHEERFVGVRIEVQAPILKVIPNKLNFGIVGKRYGYSRSQTITVSNQGAGVLIGAFEYIPWIRVKPNSFRCPPGRSQNFAVMLVPNTLPRQSEELVSIQYQISIKSNAIKQEKIPVNFDVRALPPVLSVVEEVTIRLKFSEQTRKGLRLTNSGDGVIEGNVEATPKWIEIENPYFKGNDSIFLIDILGSNFTGGKRRGDLVFTEKNTEKKLSVSVTLIQSFTRFQTLLVWSAIYLTAIAVLIVTSSIGAQLPWFRGTDVWNVFRFTLYSIGIFITICSLFVAFFVALPKFFDNFFNALDKQYRFYNKRKPRVITAILEAAFTLVGITLVGAIIGPIFAAIVGWPIVFLTIQWFGQVSALGITLSLILTTILLATIIFWLHAISFFRSPRT